LVNNAAVADAHAVDIFAAAEFCAAVRSGLNGQRINGIAEAQVEFAIS
jgi:hypothetical protein